MLFARREFWITCALLLGSNVFMTFAWYGHLKFKTKALLTVILISWGIAFFEYCLQVPANRIGSGAMTPSQLKVLQEVITFTVFAIFTTFYFKTVPTVNDAIAFALIIAAVGVSLFQPF